MSNCRVILSYIKKYISDGMVHRIVLNTAIAKRIHIARIPSQMSRYSSYSALF